MTLHTRLPPSDMALPPPDTKRWSPSRKAAVIAASRAGLLSREEARIRYMLSEEEFAEWERAFDCNGVPGLRTTRLQSYRYPRPYAAQNLPLNFAASQRKPAVAAKP